MPWRCPKEDRSAPLPDLPSPLRSLRAPGGLSQARDQLHGGDSPTRVAKMQLHPRLTANNQMQPGLPRGKRPSRARALRHRHHLGARSPAGLALKEALEPSILVGKAMLLSAVFIIAIPSNCARLLTTPARLILPASVRCQLLPLAKDNQLRQCSSLSAHGLRSTQASFTSKRKTLAIAGRQCLTFPSHGLWRLFLVWMLPSDADSRLCRCGGDKRHMPDRDVPSGMSDLPACFVPGWLGVTTADGQPWSSVPEGSKGGLGGGGGGGGGSCP